jgi:hypothetical protein
MEALLGQIVMRCSALCKSTFGSSKSVSQRGFNSTAMGPLSCCCSRCLPQEDRGHGMMQDGHRAS